MDMEKPTVQLVFYPALTVTLTCITLEVLKHRSRSFL